MRKFALALRVFAVAIVFASLSHCGSTPTGPQPTPDSSTAIFVGAGDIARCGSDGMEATARLLDTIDGAVFTAGDNAYDSGTAEEFQNCYEPHWGRHKARTHPTPGNHDYGTPGAAPYFAYFGANAGPSGTGYYSYTVGSWLILALDSEVPHDRSSTQLQWVQAQLAAYKGACAAAIWHRPRFTSGPNLDNPDMGDLWQVLYDANVDFVVNGHDHIYERFAPQNPSGVVDPARGLRQFTVGTGGVPLYQVASVHANSEVRSSTFGVMIFTLSAAGYTWEFRPVAGSSFTDSGAAVCH